MISLFTPPGLDSHSYSVYWTLSVKVIDENGNLCEDSAVDILDKYGDEIASVKTTNKGIAQFLLPEYSFSGSERRNSSPYTVIIGRKKKIVNLDRDLEITLLNR